MVSNELDTWAAPKREGATWFEKMTLGQVVDRAAERWRDREALWFEGRRWSFAQFRDETERAARALIGAGVQPGDHVCLWLGNCPGYLFLQFAIAKIGAVLVPINTRFRTRDMAYIVSQSDATTLISAARSESVDYLAMIEELVPELRQQEAEKPRRSGTSSATARHPDRGRADAGHAALGCAPRGRPARLRGGSCAALRGH